MFEPSDMYRAAEIRKARKLMSYTEDDCKKDWELAMSLAVLGDRFEGMLEECFARIHAYIAIHGDPKFFDATNSNGAYEEMSKLCKEFAEKEKRGGR